MTSDELYQLVEDPGLLSEETLPELRRLVEEYPYFNTVKLLYLKNLSVLKDIRYSSELKKLAISVPDRKRLFMLVEGSNYGISSDVEAKEPDATSDSFALIDAFLAKHETNADNKPESSLLFQPSASSDYIYWSLTQKESGTEETEVEPLHHQDLIDTFISNDEKRCSGICIDNEDSTTTQLDTPEAPATSIDDSYFTETLARIYIKQKRYEKALQIIQSLSLKYPEKNIYFADQIRFLEKLIINTKK